jgi:hypothetical protein
MTDSQNEKMEISYNIKRIKDIYFNVNEYLYDPAKTIKIELNQHFGINLENNLVNCSIRIYLHYEDSPQNILAEIKVENVFSVNNLNTIAKEKGGTDYIPPDLIIALLGLSVSHGRALFSKNLAGTVFQDVYLPISNPAAIAKHFYPAAFLNNELIASK